MGVVADVAQQAAESASAQAVAQVSSALEPLLLARQPSHGSYGAPWEVPGQPSYSGTRCGQTIGPPPLISLGALPSPGQWQAPVAALACGSQSWTLDRNRGMDPAPAQRTILNPHQNMPFTVSPNSVQLE